MLACKIGDVDQLFGGYDAAKRKVKIGSYTRRYTPAKLSESGRCVMRRDEVQSFAIPAKYMTKLGVANPNCILKHGCKHRLQIAGGAADDLKHFRRGRLLLSSFAQFAGKPSDLRLILSRRRIGTWDSLRRIAAFRLWRLSTSPFGRFAACLGAPFHRVPVNSGAS